MWNNVLHSWIRRPNAVNVKIFPMLICRFFMSIKTVDYLFAKNPKLIYKLKEIRIGKRKRKRRKEGKKERRVAN